MRQHKHAIRNIALTVAALTVGGVAPAFASTAPDFTKLGFPTVVASTTVQVGQAATLQYGELTVKIPKGAFSQTVKFELLEGQLSNFLTNVPSGQTPLVDFAFKVVNTQTNQLVAKFHKPVIILYSDQAITLSSKYWDITPTGKYVANPLPPKVVGSTLKHGNAAAAVGWVITAPATPVANTTKPVTGVPLEDWLAVGAVLVVGGSVLLATKRKSS
ncbi:MAG: hypothetical protein OWR52_01715 [Acidibacillus sp.]|uniref:Gram-positive cocci surface proteins LPxTG domain-containing protein n=1 Tax=Sulfoacidibacillus ferrooxidans TaxID=2005001 RepID=A0A9X2AEV3_9BACL|nr:hypothetical protein [Sulfoacidibacillus ferrooxidans]MCI0183747.1 hypothetical protein [Sulfoacidibacillus ferrooxidans]MCY0892215.1 hypothetical protein [Acidibacillus sp.]